MILGQRVHLCIVTPSTHGADITVRKAVPGLCEWHEVNVKQEKHLLDRCVIEGRESVTEQSVRNET